VNVFVANSKFIQGRIKRYYHRDSTVIYPPIFTSMYSKKRAPTDDYYLIVGRQVASKRLDLAVDAFNKLGLPLKVAGVGEELDRQRPRAKANIEFLGHVNDEERDMLFSGAKAFIFPPEEDFGMVPLEAMAAGTPVIAFNGGGAPEYVSDGLTGILFDQQTPESLIEAVMRFQEISFDDAKIRGRAEEFDTAIFRRRMANFVEQQWSLFSFKKT
jgi:glycosyltransferase involved in cell wall biosynthesis